MVFEILKVPMYMLDKNKFIILDVDIFYVNKIPFFTSLSRNIQFNTIQHVLNRKKITIYGAILLVCKIYGSRGFTVKVVNGDNEFACLKEDLLAIGITLNIAVANEHCPFVERRIRLIKERGRALRHTLQYNIMPKLLVVELVYFVVHWSNGKVLGYLTTCHLGP